MRACMTGHWDQLDMKEMASLTLVLERDVTDATLNAE
jgi:hypothetical protein